MLKRKTAHQIIMVRMETTVAEAVEILTREHIGSLIIVGEDGRLAGIVTETDIVRAIPGFGVNLLSQSIVRIQSGAMVTCGPDSHVDEIMREMTDKRCRHMPVLADERLIGIISIGDVVKFRLEELAAESTRMRNYITGVE